MASLHFFEDYLNDLYEKKKVKTKYPDSHGNVPFCCPFPHTREVFNPETWETSTEEYYEKQPSCSINLDMRVFHCFTCNRTMSEMEFAKNITGKTEEEITKEFLSKEELTSISATWEHEQHKSLLENEEVLQKLKDLTISMDVIKELKLGYMTNRLATPVFKRGYLVNIARYDINHTSQVKVLYNENANSGDIVPFDVWVKDDRTPTVICEGEKDMLVARSHGFNAITLTGGSQSNLLEEYLSYFKQRTVYICYDNDNPGRTGALKLYKSLQNSCKDIYIANVGLVCQENKEDVTDFFVKYQKTADDFTTEILSKATKPSKEELEDVEVKNELKITKIDTNIRNSILRRKVKSVFQVVATCTETYAVPEYAIFKTKFELKGDSKTWYLSPKNESFLELMEGKISKTDLPNILARLCGLEKNWQKLYTLEYGKLKTIYKVSVVDQVKDNDEKASEQTIDLYTRVPLQIGNTYMVTYRIFPHPRNGRKLIAIADDVYETDYSFDTSNKEYTDSLDKFKINTTIKDKLNDLYESARYYIAPYLNYDLWLIMELVFNSPLDITYRNEIRGALDVFILGDTRTGKSETSKALVHLYDFGEVIPLKTATVASIIGGTDDKIKKTKLGVLPKHHKELAVLEEFSGAPTEFIKTLTEIRSSNMVKIYRVAGDIQAPCKLRMITISNPISDNGNIMTLSSYPSGVEPINELIKSPEDIARYDLFTLVPSVENLTNPFNTEIDTSKRLEKTDYEHKSRWIRSLTAKNVVISNELGTYIFQEAIKLNELFECSFTVFGSETDKKIARLASALACMLVSTVDYEHIIVTREHVDFVVNLLKRNYDNNFFRLKEIAQEEKSYKKVVPNDTETLQKLYPKNVTFIDFLANSSKVSRNELMTVSGLNKDEFSKIFNILTARKFVKLTKDQVVPTIKFRNTYKLLDKSFNMNDAVYDDNESVF